MNGLVHQATNETGLDLPLCSIAGQWEDTWQRSCLGRRSSDLTLSSRREFLTGLVSQISPSKVSWTMFFCPTFNAKPSYLHCLCLPSSHPSLSGTVDHKTPLITHCAGEYRWEESHQVAEYTNWASREPNSASQRCVWKTYDALYGWHDVDCSRSSDDVYGQIHALCQADRQTRQI